MNKKNGKHIKFINRIFGEQSFFENKILGVDTSQDRLEIMQILSTKLIENDLKHELNFLHMKSLSSFKFSLIIHLLFKEFASEWVSFAIEELSFSKEEALDEIQDKKRVLYLHDIVKFYFANYKIEFVKKIADSFISLVDIAPTATFNNKIVKEVLESNLLKNDNVLVVHSYHQLWSRVKEAHNKRSFEIAKIQVQIADLSTEKESEKTVEHIKNCSNKIKKLEEKSLGEFSESLLRIRSTMINVMLQMEV